jgi:ligand-binding sensor domain-containing protein
MHSVRRKFFFPFIFLITVGCASIYPGSNAIPLEQIGIAMPAIPNDPLPIHFEIQKKYETTPEPTSELIPTTQIDRLRNRIGWINNVRQELDTNCWDFYSFLDGLEDNEQQFITEGPRNVMWFASETGGVSRFDGKSFEFFPIREAVRNVKVPGSTRKAEDWIIKGIQAQSDGTLWVGIGVKPYWREEDDGFLLKLKDGKWEVIQKINGVQMLNIRPLWVTEKNVLWVGAARMGKGPQTQQLCSLEKDIWECYPLSVEDYSEYANSIAGVAEQDLWIGTYGGRVIHFKDGKQWVYDLFKYFTHTGRIKKVVYNPTDHSIWVLAEYVVARLQGGKWSFYADYLFLRNKETGVGKLSTIEIDSRGNVWLGSMLKGMWYFREGIWNSIIGNRFLDGQIWKERKTINNIDLQESTQYSDCALPYMPPESSLIYDFFRSEDGNMWVITGFVFRYKNCIQKP